MSIVTPQPDRPALDAAPAAAPAPSPARPAASAPIEVANVSRWYGDVVAVNRVSFAVAGGVTGLLGPNGAGKTTLLHMMAGLLAPSDGSVRILGRAPHRDTSIYAQISLVPEREAIYPFLSGWEYVRFNARLQGLRDVDAATRRAIERVGLTDAQDRRIGTYSKGMQQRIKVAGALVHDPVVLLLDEPYNGMDPRQRLAMMELLDGMAAEGRTIIFSSHILEEVERVAQSILVMVSGRLAASGDFRAIRQLMTDRPHSLTIRSSDDRKLARALLGQHGVFSVELRRPKRADGPERADAPELALRTTDLEGFRRTIARLAREEDVRLLEVLPADESLESVFTYLVQQ